MNQIPKILIVDDEANILQSLRRTLRKFDIDVVTTTSPIEGAPTTSSMAERSASVRGR